MQCPKCYDKEISTDATGSTERKIHVKMELMSWGIQCDILQCPRCLLLRKRQKNFLQSGVVEEVSAEEANEIIAKNSKITSGGWLCAGVVYLTTLLFGKGDPKKK